MVPPGEGNEARGDGRRGVGVSHSTAEAGELSPRDPVEGRGHRQVAPLEGKTANTPRLGPVSTSRQRIAELARQAVGMAVAIAWLPGPAGTRRRVAKLSVEEPDAAEPARPDLWGARVSNDTGLPDLATSGRSRGRPSHPARRGAAPDRRRQRSRRSGWARIHKDAGWNRHAPNIVDAARSRSLDPERRYRSDSRRIRSRLNGPTGLGWRHTRTGKQYKAASSPPFKIGQNPRGACERK